MNETKTSLYQHLNVSEHINLLLGLFFIQNDTSKPSGRLQEVYAASKEKMQQLLSTRTSA